MKWEAFNLITFTRNFQLEVAASAKAAATAATAAQAAEASSAAGGHTGEGGSRRAAAPTTTLRFPTVSTELLSDSVLIESWAEVCHARTKYVCKYQSCMV